jgi:hypothetical protein
MSKIIYLLQNILIMNPYFLNISEEEKTSITEKHRSLYDGYQVMQPKGNMSPLTVGDYALDKEGVTVSNLGEVKKYTNTEVNKKLKKQCDECGGLYEGEMCECGTGKMYEGEMCEECGGEIKEGETCEQCSGGKYTMEDLEENVKLKSKSNMVMEDIDKSLDWFKKLIK